MYNNHRKEISKGYRLTTNNRMELMAVIAGIQTITKKEIPVIIYSDSKYVVRAIEEGWLINWMKTNLAQTMNIKLKWVKGHADNPFNNRCDELATAAADGKNLIADEGYEETQALL